MVTQFKGSLKYYVFRMFFAEYHHTKQQYELLPKEEYCCDCATD